MSAKGLLDLTREGDRSGDVAKRCGFIDASPGRRALAVNGCVCQLVFRHDGVALHPGEGVVVEPALLAASCLRATQYVLLGQVDNRLVFYRERRFVSSGGGKVPAA